MSKKVLNSKEALELHFRLNPKELELKKIRTANYRAMESGLNISCLTYKEWISLLRKYKFSCLKCGQHEPRIVLVMDHIVPLSKGGTSDITNIQPLCQTCNASKGNKTTDYRLE